MVILGNCLVIAAVFLSSKLRSVTNLFIVSLAVADLMVGLTVLPFSAVWEVFELLIALVPHDVVTYISVQCGFRLHDGNPGSRPPTRPIVSLAIPTDPTRVLTPFFYGHDQNEQHDRAVFELTRTKPVRQLEEYDIFFRLAQ
ncbi:unnamed protein product [Nesidiocoris tenuis]|uniref:G-protein coupled receptors family 1 profile domain-containing protein n=1 Tax=Nesidiocoris tenuis TaxID=355587 RepID=A0A6H5G6N6_9HEMI|nr:unnamed protein product [Nesidiocoris tenuis]